MNMVYILVTQLNSQPQIVVLFSVNGQSLHKAGSHFVLLRGEKIAHALILS